MDFFPLGTISFANSQWLWVSAGFTAVGLFLLLHGYARSPLRGGVKWLALELKALGLVLLALSLMEPVWTDEFPKKGANDLILLADNSRGLAVQPPDEAGALGAEMLAALRPGFRIGGTGEAEDAHSADSTTDTPAWLNTLTDRYRLRNYLFDRRLERSDDFGQLDLSGDASRLLSGLRSLRTRYARRPLAAAVVFTDGNATDLDALAEVLEEWTSLPGHDGEPGRIPPIFPVLVGREVVGSDLAVEAVTASQSAFEDAPLQLAVQVSARGDFDHPAEVYATNHRREEVAAESVLFPPLPGSPGSGSGGELRRETVHLRVSAVPPGVSFYRVGVRFAEQRNREAPAEITLENNSRLVSVNRGSGPFRVLYVSGRPNWEYKFLRRALAGDADLDLVALIRIARREPKFEWRGRGTATTNPLFRGFESDIPEETRAYDEPVFIRLNTADEEELRDGFPKTAEDLFPRYRAVILDDVEADFFTAEQQNLLDRFVSHRGGTVLMLGGQESFQKGGWNNTPVGRMLPVYLDDTARPLMEPPALDAAWQLTREGWLEPWTRLREKREDEEIRFAHMPTFWAVNRLPAIKPGASLLATVHDGEGRTLPALVTQRYGEGRTAALAVADLWRWGLKGDEHPEDMAKAWRQLVRWAVVDVPGRVQIETLARSEGALPVQEIAVRVRDREFRPQDDASVRMKIAGGSHSSQESSGEGEPDREQEQEQDQDQERKQESVEIGTEPSLEIAGEFTARHYAEEEGGYRVAATVRDGEGELIGEVEAGWASNPAADEFRRIGPNRALLEQLAAATGGEVLAMSQADRLPALLDDLVVPVMERQQTPLWHTPWIFLLALGCFMGEWALRRWKGVL